MYRRTFIAIDIDKIIHNARYFISRTDKKIIGVVKANGYDLIDFMEAFALKEAGVDFFAVSSVEEALNLRKAGIDDEILILGYVPENALQTVRQEKLSIVTVSKDYVENSDLHDVKVHLKLNTGMNRIGVNADEAREVLDILLKEGAIVEGVMSHLSSADTDIEYTNRQYRDFEDCVRSLNYPFRYVHIAATDGSLILDDRICNCRRIGIGMLGYSSYETDLQPVLSLYSEVTMVKQIAEGETVSYGRHFVSDGSGYILTLPIGYADGFRRSNTGKEVYVDGEYGTIVGSICMDQLMVLTKHHHPVGTRVELFGDHIDITRRAAELDTINYELITGLSDRLTRVYYRNGEVIREISPHFD